MEEKEGDIIEIKGNGDPLEEDSIMELESGEGEELEDEEEPKMSLKVEYHGKIQNLNTTIQNAIKNREELENLIAANVVVKGLTYKVAALDTFKHVYDLRTAFQERWRLHKVRKREKTVLENVNFFIEPKMFLLVLGPPESGRTSILNMLANRIEDKGKLEGQIYFNEKPIDPRIHHRRVAYVCTSDDIHIPSLTVEETFQFALRLQSDSRSEEHTSEL